MNVFVSYSHEDADKVNDDLLWLSQIGMEVWYDDRIGPGSRWRQQIANAIDNCDVFLFFVSKSSVESEHCLKELDYAMDVGKRVLPVHIESTEVPNELRFSMGDVQAVMRFAGPRDTYRDKLSAGLTGPLPHVVEQPQRASRYWWAVPTVALLLAVALTSFWPDSPERFDGSESALAEQRSVAVMRFVNIGGDNRFSDGLCERLLHLLSGVKALLVPSRGRSWRWPF